VERRKTYHEILLPEKCKVVLLLAAQLESQTSSAGFGKPHPKCRFL